MMGVQKMEYSGNGMHCVYQNEKWLVGIKNWKPENDLDQFAVLEQHHETDELFVLLQGSCVLLTAEKEGGSLRFSAVPMQPHAVYCIPRDEWHTTITSQDAKLILIEDGKTGAHNSAVMTLSQEQLAAAKECIGRESKA